MSTPDARQIAERLIIARAVIHQSPACEGVIRDLECADCDDDACECECHFDPESEADHG